MLELLSKMCIWLWNILIPCKDSPIHPCSPEKLLEHKCRKGIQILNSSYRGIMTIKDQGLVMHSYWYYTRVRTKPFSKICCICQEEHANILFYPCTHKVCCDECMLKHFIHTASMDIAPFCPVCKAPVQQFSRFVLDIPSIHTQRSQ